MPWLILCRCLLPFLSINLRALLLPVMRPLIAVPSAARPGIIPSLSGSIVSDDILRLRFSNSFLSVNSISTWSKVISPTSRGVYPLPPSHGLSHSTRTCQGPMPPSNPTNASSSGLPLLRPVATSPIHFPPKANSAAQFHGISQPIYPSRDPTRLSLDRGSHHSLGSTSRSW